MFGFPATDLRTVAHYWVAAVLHNNILYLGCAVTCPRGHSTDLGEKKKKTWKKILTHQHLTFLASLVKNTSFSLKWQTDYFLHSSGRKAPAVFS